MDDLQRLVDLHLPAVRQGPGGEPQTKRALELAGIDRSQPLKIADIGCGTGAASILLARELNAQITALDFLPQFLDELESRANNQGVGDCITTLNGSMDTLSFSPEHFDVIWSEGAIYNMGFEAGVSSWKRFLKPGGKLVVSEMTWLTAARPSELQSYWEREYPEIDVASAKFSILEQHGFSPEGYFVLPPHCWLENYYRPMQRRFDRFLEQHDQSEQAKAIVATERCEMALYEKYSDYYSYGVYVAKKCEGF